MTEAELRDRRREAVKLAAMRKEAFLGSMAIGHLGSNAVMKFLRGTNWWKNKVVPQQMSRGIRHGLTGQRQGLGSRILERTFAPEMEEAYHMARQVGSQLRSVPENQRIGALANLRNTVAARPELANTPVLRSIPQGVDRLFRHGAAGVSTTRLPTWASTHLPTLSRIPRGVRSLSERHLPTFTKAYDKVLPNIAAASAVVDPGIAGHMGINAARMRLANSPFGREFGIRQFERGLRQGGETGMGRHVSDILISPYAGDARDIGAALAKVPAVEVPGLAKAFAGVLPETTAQAKETAKQKAKETLGALFTAAAHRDPAKAEAAREALRQAINTVGDERTSLNAVLRTIMSQT